MGQYYLIANMDKKEVLCINGRFPGMKLLEIAYSDTDSIAIVNQIAEKWRGDTVFLVGDYADLSDPEVTYFDELRKWTDKLHVVKSLYHYIHDNFKKVEGDTEDKGYRFLYNHKEKVYIDLLHIPKSREDRLDYDLFINPLPLLIAMGNGRGGGDYGNYENEHLVGSWCDSIASVEITKEPKDELGYEEYHPDFR